MQDSVITALEVLIMIGTALWAVQYFVSRRVHAYEKPTSVNMQVENLPKVSIVLPVYRERKQSIEKTLDSVSSQNYPKNLLEVLIVIDKDDVNTFNEALRAAGRFLSSLNIKVITNDNAGRSLRP